MPRFNHSILLYNGNAEGSTTEAALSASVPILSRESRHLELIQTHSEEEVLEVCMHLDPSLDALFVLGGDGTVHLVTQVLARLEEPPPLGILPHGTCNDFARTLGIPLAIDQAAEALMTGELKKVDVGKIDEHAFLNFAGIGLIAEASINIDPELKERYGKLSYFRSGLISLRQVDPFPISLNIDGKAYEEQGVLALVMNGKSIGTHMFPLPSLDPSDGLLDIFIIQEASLTALREWFSLSRSDFEEADLELVRHFKGKHVEIQTEQPMDIDMDGEVYLQTPAAIDIKPLHLTFLAPREDMLP